MGGDGATDVGQELVAGGRHHRSEDCANKAKAFRYVREAGIEAGAIVRLTRLSEFPRRTRFDVGVHGADEDPEGFEGVTDLIIGEGFVVLLDRITPELTEVLFELFVRGGGWNRAGIVASDHVEESIDEVAEIVAEVRLVAVLEGGR